MHELDLIPASYRERQKIQRQCTVFLGVLVVMVVLMAGAKTLLIARSDQLQEQIQTLENGKKLKQEQQQQFSELLAQERLLSKRLEILNSLRGGPSALQLWLAIDRVLDGDVWFNEWSLQRSTEADVVKPQSSASGLIIVIPATESPAGQEQSWQLNTRMEISGQALDHSKLAAFVGRLLKQPEIEDVQVLSTGLRTFLNSQVVDFKMVVIINNQVMAGHV